MVCKNCGKEIEEVMAECPCCGTPIEQSIMEDNQFFSTEEGSANPLLGKEYVFQSTRFRWAYEIIRSRVSVGEDRLFFECETKRFNVVPAIFFEDITGIRITTTMAPIYIWLAIACFVAGFASGISFVGVPVALWIGANKKITIYQRNGKDVHIIERSKTTAEQFVSDMKILLGI